MATVRDLGIASMKDLGVLADGEVPTAGQAQDFLDALNRLIDQWAAERLQIYALRSTSFPLIQHVGAYTVGIGGTANPAAGPNTERPVFMDHVLFLSGVSTTPSTSVASELTELTDDAFAALPNPTMESAQPSHWHYKPTFPLGTLNIYPTPDGSSHTSVVFPNIFAHATFWAPRAVSEFLTINDVVALPPGYRRMLVANLALEIAPSYVVEPSNTLVRRAIESKAVVKAANQRLSDLSFPPESLFGYGGSWSIYTGP